MDSPENDRVTFHDEPTELALSENEGWDDTNDLINDDDKGAGGDSDDDEDGDDSPVLAPSKKAKMTPATKTSAGKVSVTKATAGKGKGKAVLGGAGKGKGKAGLGGGGKRKVLDIPTGVGLYGDVDENPLNNHLQNPWNNLLHPTKKLKSGEPAKKPLNKAEKDAKAAWEMGKKEMLELRDAAKSATGKKKAPFTQTVVDKVCFAIQLCFPKSARAQAYIPKEEQSQDVYQQSTRGRKAKADEESGEKVVAGLLAAHQHDRRMAFQALKSAPFWQSLGSLAEKQLLVRKLMEMYNERYRQVLYNNHGIRYEDIPNDQYYLGTNNFLKTDMKIEDGVDIGRKFPIITNTAPVMLTAPIIPSAAGPSAALSSAAMAGVTSTELGNDGDSLSGEEDDTPAHVVDLENTDNSESGEMAVKMGMDLPVTNLPGGETGELVDTAGGDGVVNTPPIGEKNGFVGVVSEQEAGETLPIGEKNGFAGVVSEQEAGETLPIGEKNGFAGVVSEQEAGETPLVGEKNGSLRAEHTHDSVLSGE